jgi:hypothetical protein
LIYSHRCIEKDLKILMLMAAMDEADIDENNN